MLPDLFDDVCVETWSYESIMKTILNEHGSVLRIALFSRITIKILEGTELKKQPRKYYKAGICCCALKNETRKA